MAKKLEGSCRCGAVRFAVISHSPYPYQLCYCAVCRKTQGGGGFAINLMGDFESLDVKGRRSLAVYRAKIGEGNGRCHTSKGQRHFCRRCGSALWLYDPDWPALVHPSASAIDTALPAPPSKVHLMLKFKAPWVKPDFGPGDERYREYPRLSIEDWHRKHRLWID
ncbi:MAG: GFA family protein [Rhizomicrobium sp.]